MKRIVIWVGTGSWTEKKILQLNCKHFVYSKNKFVIGKSKIKCPYCK